MNPPSVQPHNHLRFAARITGRDALRFTPAGLEAVDFELSHSSEQQEGGSTRQVECVVGSVAFGAVARRVVAAPLNVLLEFEGFIAARQRAPRQVQFHVTTLIEE